MKTRNITVDNPRNLNGQSPDLLGNGKTNEDGRPRFWRRLTLTFSVACVAVSMTLSWQPKKGNSTRNGETITQESIIQKDVADTSGTINIQTK